MKYIKRLKLFYIELLFDFLDDALESDANKSKKPISGVKNNEEKKYPQKPIFRFTPKRAISKDIPR